MKTNVVLTGTLFKTCHIYVRCSTCFQLNHHISHIGTMGRMEDLENADVILEHSLIPALCCVKVCDEKTKSGSLNRIFSWLNRCST